MADNDCDRLISFRDYINVYNMYIYEGAFSRIDPYHKYAKSGLNPVTNPCMYEQFDWKLSWFILFICLFSTKYYIYLRKFIIM